METQMADKMLRHIPTGTLYIWQPSFAQRPDFEDVVEEPVAEEPALVAEPVEPKQTRRSKKTAQAEVVAPAVEEPAPLFDDSSLSADASRGLP
jgi:hypothetical protein